MTQKHAAIVQKIDRLDHPDAHLQDAILDEFSRQPETARPAVLANLPVVNARIRRALLRWLDGVLTDEATLPLMRYVFDQRGTISEQTGRSMAMALLLKRARTTDIPEERGRLRAFAEDLCGDDHPDIRRLAVEILSYVGNASSMCFVEPYTDDEDPEVRRSVRRTLEVLADAPRDKESQRDPKHLTSELLRSAGPRRRQLLRSWRRHDERTSIALDIVRNRGELREVALQILLQEPSDKARPFLASMIIDDPDSDLAALALRLLAKLGSSDGASPDEINAIRRAFNSTTILSQTASFAAIKAFGLGQFAPALVELTESRDLAIGQPAAEAVNGLLDESHHELCEQLRVSLRTNERRRRGDPKNTARIHIVAHLLSALADVVTPSTIGVETLHQTIFQILESGGSIRPIRIKSIELLLASTPADGLGPFERWDTDQATMLIELLDHASRPAVQRIARLLVRGAPAEMEGLDMAARRMWNTGYVDLTQSIVPLLERSDSEQAKEWLREIAEGRDRRAADAARHILRQHRNQSDVIDAEFIPRNDD